MQKAYTLVLTNYSITTMRQKDKDWQQPELIKNLISFAHKYPVEGYKDGKRTMVPDPQVLKDADQLEDFMYRKAKNPTQHATTWWRKIA